MLKIIKDILSWPIFKIVRREEQLSPEEEEEFIRVEEQVAHDFTGEGRESCPYLDLGDRASVLFGSPALKVYLEAQKFYNYLTGSVSEDASDILYTSYVDKAQSMEEEACDALGITPPPRPPMPIAPSIPEGMIAALTTEVTWTSAEYVIDGRRARTKIKYKYIEGYPNSTEPTWKWREIWGFLYTTYGGDVYGWTFDTYLPITLDDYNFVINLRKQAEAKPEVVWLTTEWVQPGVEAKEGNVKMSYKYKYVVGDPLKTELIEKGKYVYELDVPGWTWYYGHWRYYRIIEITDEDRKFVISLRIMAEGG